MHHENNKNNKPSLKRDSYSQKREQEEKTNQSLKEIIWIENGKRKRYRIQVGYL